MKELILKLKEKPVGVALQGDSHFKEITKNNKAITLIALIITIVVMLILVGVTVTFTIGENGILQNAKEAKFKQEVSAIKDYVEIEKLAIIAENKGSTENLTFSPSDLTVNVPVDLKIKYIDNGKIFAKTDGKLYYDKDHQDLSNEQKQWLRELQILEGSRTTVQGTFKEDVETIADEYKYGQIYDTYSIYQQVKTEHPTAAIVPIVYMPDFNNLPYPYPVLASYERSEFVHNILETISMLKAKYPNPQDLTDEIKTEVRESLEAEDIASNPNSLNISATNEFISNSTTVADLITQMNTYIAEKHDDDYYLAVKGEEQFFIHNSGIIDYDSVHEEFIILSGQAAKNYEYEIVESIETFEEFKLSRVNITKYKGTESQIKVPFMIMTEEGETLLVSKIKSNAFANTKPVKLEVGSTFMQYNVLLGNRVKTSYDDLTTIDFAANFGVELEESGTYTNTRQEKNEFILSIFATILPEGEDIKDYYEAQGEGNEQMMYIYTSTMRQLPPACQKTNVKYVEPIQSIVFSEGIEGIEANAISGNWFLDVYIPKTLDRSKTSAEAFAGAGISNIRTRYSESELKTLNGNSKENILGSTFYAEDCELVTD